MADILKILPHYTILEPSELYNLLEKVTRFTGFAGGKVIKAFRLQSSSLFADSTWPFLN